MRDLMESSVRMAETASGSGRVDSRDWVRSGGLVVGVFTGGEFSGRGGGGARRKTHFCSFLGQGVADGAGTAGRGWEEAIRGGWGWGSGRADRGPTGGEKGPRRERRPARWGKFPRREKGGSARKSCMLPTGFRFRRRRRRLLRWRFRWVCRWGGSGSRLATSGPPGSWRRLCCRVRCPSIRARRCPCLP